MILLDLLTRKNQKVHGFNIKIHNLMCSDPPHIFHLNFKILAYLDEFAPGILTLDIGALLFQDSFWNFLYTVTLLNSTSM